MAKPDHDPPGGPFVVESPHAFYRNGSWWLFNTVNNDSVWAESNAFTPTDVESSGARWTQTQKLWNLVPPGQAGSFFYWHATEYLQINSANDLEYLAAYTDDTVGITYTQMRPAAPPYLFNMDCPSPASVNDPSPRASHPSLLLMGARPARTRAALRVELPKPMKIHLAIYDVLGRRVRTIMDGSLPSGSSDLAWNGDDASGAPVNSGLYFAGLVTAEGRHSVRVLLVR